MRPFDYYEPETLQEALDLLERFGERAKVLAGGTDLIVQMKQGRVCPQVVIGLGKLRELDFAELDRGERGKSLRLGPMLRLSRIVGDPLFTGSLSIFREAAEAVGDVQIRNAATLGGNLANGSPSADMVPPLLALGASLRIRKKGDERILGFEDLCCGPFRTGLAADELIVEIMVDPFPEGKGVYLWMPKRTAVDETLVGVAAWISWDSEKKICMRASIALNSVAPVPVRARKAESSLQGEVLSMDHFRRAGEIAVQEISPRSRAGYRTELVSVLVEEALREAWRRVSV